MKEHILVSLSSAPSNARTIRTAATMAAAFGCSFTALFVRTPSHDLMSEADKERLRSNTKLTAIAPNLDIHIIPDASVDGSYRPKQAKKKWDTNALLKDLAITVGILILASVLGYGFSKAGFTEANIITVYLLGVLLTAMVTSTRSSYVLSAVGSIVVFNFFFTSPQFSFKVYEQGYPVTFLIMLIAALLVGTLTDRMKEHTNQSAQAAYRTNLPLETNQLIQKATTDEEILQAARLQVSKLLNRNTTVMPGVMANASKDTLLCLLAKDVGKVLTHTYLTDKIWGTSWESDMASLRVHMATLRKKVEKDPDAQYIQTHIGIGYRMLKNE